MGGDIGSFADIGLGDITSFASDIGSVVTDFGTEFMSALPDVTQFQVPSFDVPSLGGFDIAGSFAGDAAWFDKFNPGSILSSIPAVSDFNLPSIQTALQTYQRFAPTVNAAASALGIQAPLAQVNQIVGQAAGIAGAAAGISGAVTGTIGRVVNSATQVASGTGFRELGAAETAQLLKNAPLVNTLADTGAAAAANAVNAATGLPIDAPGAVNAITGATPQYTSVFDPETQTWSVFDNTTGTTVQTGLSEQQAILAEQDLNVTGDGISLNASTVTPEDPYEVARLAAEAQSNAPGPTEADVISASNGITVAQVNNARYQQSIRELRNNKAQSSDWRVRLRLAPNSKYLYNDTNIGVLAPLRITDGVIFPYTPAIETAYKANYESYDLVHSNYRGYFYKNSYVDAVNVRASFTAQDTKEADYLLAVIHFFRSCTKMFYGQDQQRGAPPPLVYLSGYGDYQFNEHPCLISQFNYTLPPDVDYIRAQSNLQSNTNQLNNRLRNPIANNPLSYSVNRLLNSNLFAGALFQNSAQTSNLANGQPTYVPTKMEISITLLPTQSRSNVSNNFSVQGFANGNLLKNGFW